jgi:hypothetical protein
VVGEAAQDGCGRRSGRNNGSGVVSLLQEQPASQSALLEARAAAATRSLTADGDGQTDRRRLSRRLTPAGGGRPQYI